MRLLIRTILLTSLLLGEGAAQPVVLTDLRARLDRLDEGAQATANDLYFFFADTALGSAVDRQAVCAARQPLVDQQVKAAADAFDIAVRLEERAPELPLEVRVRWSRAGQAVYNEWASLQKALTLVCLQPATAMASETARVYVQLSGIQGVLYGLLLP